VPSGTTYFGALWREIGLPTEDGAFIVLENGRSIIPDDPLR